MVKLRLVAWNRAASSAFHRLEDHIALTRQRCVLIKRRDGRPSRVLPVGPRIWKRLQERGVVDVFHDEAAIPRLQNLRTGAMNRDYHCYSICNL